MTSSANKSRRPEPVLSACRLNGGGASLKRDAVSCLRRQGQDGRRIHAELCRHHDRVRGHPVADRPIFIATARSVADTPVFMIRFMSANTCVVRSCGAAEWKKRLI